MILLLIGEYQLEKGQKNSGISSQLLFKNNSVSEKSLAYSQGRYCKNQICIVRIMWSNDRNSLILSGNLLLLYWKHTRTIIFLTFLRLISWSIIRALTTLSIIWISMNTVNTHIKLSNKKYFKPISIWYLDLSIIFYALLNFFCDFKGLYIHVSICCIPQVDFVDKITFQFHMKLRHTLKYIFKCNLNYLICGKTKLLFHWKFILCHWLASLSKCKFS